MTESSNNKNYNAADFERYHAGKMPAAEMHALEKAAMEDPFLADALEGYAVTATPRQDLDSIRNRLFEQKEEKKALPFIRKPYSWMRAAAIIIFIAGGAWLAFRLTGSKKTEMAVENKNNEAAPATDTLRKTDMAGTLTPSVQDSTSNSTASNITNTNSRQGNSEQNFSTTLKNPETTGFETYYTPAPPLQNKADSVVSVATADKAAPAIDAGRVILADSLFFHNDAVAYNNTNMNASATAPKMTLPGYNNAYKLSTSKDSNEAGHFLAKESKSKAPVANDTVSNLNIVLQNDNEGLSEVVVSAGKKQESTERRSFELKVDTLEPKDGWARFDDYIARNIQVPDELKSKQSLSGEVELSFDVNSNGEPVNITVTKSLCEKCDQEAIRLLKEGPKWKKKKLKKGKVTIKF